MMLFFRYSRTQQLIKITGLRFLDDGEVMSPSSFNRVTIKLTQFQGFIYQFQEDLPVRRRWLLDLGWRKDEGRLLEMEGCGAVEGEPTEKTWKWVAD